MSKEQAAAYIAGLTREEKLLLYEFLNVLAAVKKVTA